MDGMRHCVVLSHLTQSSVWLSQQKHGIGLQVCQIQSTNAKRSKMPKLLRKFGSRKKDRYVMVCCRAGLLLLIHIPLMSMLPIASSLPLHQVLVQLCAKLLQHDVLHFLYIIHS